MRTIEAAREYFAPHPPTETTGPAHTAVREVFARTLEELWPLLPDGPDKTVALRSLLRAQMDSNLAIALTAPAAAPADPGARW